MPTTEHLQEGTWNVSSRPRTFRLAGISFTGTQEDCVVVGGRVGHRVGCVPRRLHLEPAVALCGCDVVGTGRREKPHRPVLLCPHGYRPAVPAARAGRQLSGFFEDAQHVDGHVVGGRDDLLPSPHATGRCGRISDGRLRGVRGGRQPGGTAPQPFQSTSVLRAEEGRRWLPPMRASSVTSIGKR